MSDKKRPWLLDGEMYQYNLGWLIDKILSVSTNYEEFKKTFEEWKSETDAAIQNGKTELSTLQKSFEDLKKFVIEYLSDLDLSADLNDILHHMLESGELSDLLKDFVASEYLQGSSFADAVSFVMPHGVLATGMKNGISASKIKICVVGDSIPYGSNQAKSNTFPNYLSMRLDGIAEVVTYAIPGENIYDFVDPSYVLSAHYEKSDYSWITTGSTWQEIVESYSPHIIIFNFGTNSWADASVNLRNRTALQAAINWCSTKSYTPIFCTPIVPNSNKLYYNTEDWIFYNTANAIREIANDNGAGLIDIFGKMCGIARNKISGVIEYEDAPMISSDAYYNLIFNKVLDWNAIKENYISFYARASHDEFLQMSFAVIDNNKILRVTEGYTGGTNSSRDLVLNILDTDPVEFSLVNNKITVNGQSLTLYQSYQDGAYDLRALNLESLIGGKTASNPYVLPDAITVGTGSDPWNGNGINHPTAFTLQTIYYPFMDELAKILINAKLFS